MKVCLFGASGRVGAALGPALQAAGHEVVEGRAAGPHGCDVAVLAHTEHLDPLEALAAGSHELGELGPTDRVCGSRRL